MLNNLNCMMRKNNNFLIQNWSIFRLPNWSCSIFIILNWNCSIFRILNWNCSIFRILNWNWSVFRILKWNYSIFRILNCNCSIFRKLNINLGTYGGTFLNWLIFFEFINFCRMMFLYRLRAKNQIVHITAIWLVSRYI